MRFDHILIGILIFSIFIVGGVMIVNDTNTNYGNVTGSNIDDDSFAHLLEESNKSIAEIQGISQEMNNKTLEGDISSTTSWDSLVQGTYSTVRFISSSFSIMNNIGSAVAMALGIPEWIYGIFIAMFIIAVIMSIVYMIFRFIPS